MADGEKSIESKSRRGFAVKLLLLFGLLAVALVLTGLGILAYRKADARATAHQQLGAIADLKLRQIVQWRQERMSDASFFGHARFVADDIAAYFANPDSATNRASVLHWLNLLKGGERYESVVIYDERGHPRLSLPEGSEAQDPEVGVLIGRALGSTNAVMSDLERQDDAPKAVRLNIAFPVFRDGNPAELPPIGVVLLRLNPKRFLFPLLESWPTPSQTAETLLVRREDQQVLYLNDLRHRPGSALEFGLPLSSPNLPAARVLQGDTSVVEGVDYRGVRVVAAGRMVPGSRWAMVSKMDQEELYAPLRQQVISLVVLLGTLLVAGGFLLSLIWHRRTNRFLARELAYQRERSALADRVNLLMRSANDIILLFDLSGRILEANDRALSTYGYSRAELERLTIRDLRAPDTRDSLDSDYQRVLEGGSVFFETVHKRQDGSTFPVEVSSRKVTSGAEDFILSIIRNITRRKETEAGLLNAKEELARANRNLEATVQERTLLLRQTIGELESFSYSLSHDMRGPLRAIQSFAQLVELDYGQVLGEDGRQHLHKIYTAAERMRRLVDDVLALTKISRSQTALRPLDAEALIQAIVEERPDFQSPRARITVEGILPRVLADEASLTQCITNLLGNAVKFVQRGTIPEVRIHAEIRDGRVRLWFQDNGIGIKPESQGKVFEMFHRDHLASTYEGSGLGLAIVRKAVQRMGGSVGVESEPGEGSRFWIELAAAEPAGEAAKGSGG